ncbi:MAG: type VI secretion system baseplate subunit TssF [Gammaproteobacteria bacterium]|nr:type VI secretion system baseplate subunit TssF [Gammaproteobacteria bacterium]
MIREYFEAEMRLLREAGQNFAEQYPEQAGMLNLKSWHDRDPYIERLLEGVAFLTAQIRQKIDDDIPEISENLLLHLWPHLLRPFPAATIMEFSSSQPEKSFVVAKGTLLESQAVGEKQSKSICKFRTTSKVIINPLTISKVAVTEAKEGGSIISLTLQCDAKTGFGQMDLSDLRFYLHADPALALQLYFALTGELTAARVRFPESPTKPAVLLGAQESVELCNLTEADILIPTAGRSFYGFHLLHEYFLFREKYFFVAIKNLAKIKWPKKCQKFCLELHTKTQLNDYHKISKENFRLHCAPAINLFKTTAEPINLTPRRYEYPLVVNTYNNDSNMLYSIDDVASINTATGARYRYYPLHAFQHKKTNERCYSVVRRSDRAYLVIKNCTLLAKEDLSCTITACNGHYPRSYLREHQINVSSKDFPNYLHFSNITRPTSLYMPPSRSNYCWSLVAHLSLHYSSLADLDTLKELLNFYDWSTRKEQQKHIDAIYDIEIKTISKFIKGALMQGIEFNLKLHEDAFSSLADIHLFGLILHHFFSMYATLNFFVSTRISCHPSNKELSWQPLLGTNRPI